MNYFHDLNKQNINNWMINLLLNTDCSTTKIIESLIHDKVNIKIHEQKKVSLNELPDDISKYFVSNGSFLHRISSLYFNKAELSYNLVYVNLDVIPISYQENLFKGDLPIGKIIANLTSQRKLLWNGYKDSKQLLQIDFATLESNIKHYPVKQYLIFNENKPCFFINETFNSQQILNKFWAAIKNEQYSLADASLGNVK